MEWGMYKTEYVNIYFISRKWRVESLFPDTKRTLGRAVFSDWITRLLLGSSCVTEKAMATHSGVLAWRIPGTGEPGGLPSVGSHRVGHDWSDLAAAVVWQAAIVSAELKRWKIIIHWVGCIREALCWISCYVKEYMSEATWGSGMIWGEGDCYKSKLTVPSEEECTIRHVLLK